MRHTSSATCTPEAIFAAAVAGTRQRGRARRASERACETRLDGRRREAEFSSGAGGASGPGGGDVTAAQGCCATAGLATPPARPFRLREGGAVAPASQTPPARGCGVGSGSFLVLPRLWEAREGRGPLALAPPTAPCMSLQGSDHLARCAPPLGAWPEREARRAIGRGLS